MRRPIVRRLNPGMVVFEEASSSERLAVRGSDPGVLVSEPTPGGGP